MKQRGHCRLFAPAMDAQARRHEAISRSSHGAIVILSCLGARCRQTMLDSVDWRWRCLYMHAFSPVLPALMCRYQPITYRALLALLTASGSMIPRFPCGWKYAQIRRKVQHATQHPKSCTTGAAQVVSMTLAALFPHQGAFLLLYTLCPALIGVCATAPPKQLWHADTVQLV